jgi:DNA polymerase II small subunit/DNA polymerase delta subunit B
MTPEETVRKLTSQGIFVTPELAESIRFGTYNESDISTEPTAPIKEKARLSVVIHKSQRQPRMTPQNYLTYYNNRFSALSKILLTKMKAISINKVNENLTEASVIGMVREKTQSGFILEDQTGEIEVVGQEAVEQDDVLGVTGNVREGKLIRSSVIWPDVPLTHKPNQISDIDLLLTGEYSQSMDPLVKDFNLVVTPGNPESFPTIYKRKLISELTNPCRITIKKGGEEFLIMFYRPPENITPEDALTLLKKRHLSPDKKEVAYHDDMFMIDPIPDILWIVGSERSLQRYKGVTVLMMPDSDAVRYDASSGEAMFAQGGAKPDASQSYINVTDKSQPLNSRL